MTHLSSVKHRNFEFNGKCLTFSQHHRATPTSLEFALGIQTLGRILPGGRKKIIVEKHPKSWWEAQVCLYGLKCHKWTVENMKSVLFAAVKEGIEVTPEIEEVEERLKKEYAELEKENRRSNDINTAGGTKTLSNVLQPTVTGSNKRTNDTQQEKATGFRDLMKEKSDAARASQLANMNRLHSALLASPSGPGDTIYGTWQIDCPEITEQWCHNNDCQKREMIWKIHPPFYCEEYIWVGFEQIVCEGVIRIDRDLLSTRWKRKKMNFTWRGRETGEMEIQCDDSMNTGYITFTSEHECQGMFGCQFGGPWAFTGKKISLKLSGKKITGLSQEFKKYEREWRKTAWII